MLVSRVPTFVARGAEELGPAPSGLSADPGVDVSAAPDVLVRAEAAGAVDKTLQRPRAGAGRGGRYAAVPPAVERFAKAIAKGDVLEIAAQVAEAGDAGKKALLESKNEHGRTPLLEAVATKQLGVAAMLVYLGADLHATDGKGLTAPFVAAAVGDARAVEFFVTDKRFEGRFNDPVGMSPRRVSEVLDALIKEQPDPAALDSVAAVLCAVPRAHFTDAMHLQKYIAHLEHFKENPLGVPAEGWVIEAFLPMRVRSLLAIAVDPKRRAELGDEARARTFLANEISNELEALRFRRRTLAIACLPDADLREELASLEAEAVRRRLCALPLGAEYSLPSGWVGHAIYVNFTARKIDGEHVLSLRVDNRGSGALRHENDSEVAIYPFVANIPASELLNPETQATLDAMIRDLILWKLAPKAQTNATGYYATLEVFRARLIANYGPVVALEGPRSFDGLNKQTTGNCVVANHEAGLHYRWGEALGAPFVAMEKEMAIARLFEKLQPAVLQAHIQANRSRISRALVTDKKQY